MSKTIFLTDRSGAEADDTCGMKYWWNRLEGKQGVVPRTEALALMVGREVHEDFSTIAEMEDISEAAVDGLIREITDPLTEDDRLVQKTMEILYRRLGWIAGYALFIEPKVRDKWENVSVEHELILDRSPLWIATTPDRVLRNKVTGQLVYKELKSTISSSGQWLDSWKYAIQLHIGMKAVEEELGTKLAYAQIMGLMKGQERDGRLSHPYVWGWRKGDEWTHEYAKARGTGWGPAPVWEYPGGVVEWVKRLGEDIATSQFPHTPPVFLNERMLDLWVERRTAREAQIAAVKDLCRTDLKARATFFEQRTKNCRPPFGPACDYLMACWNATIGEDPIKSGEFVERIPHHDLEVVLKQETE